jgi:dTDP-4-dehydrorhamnose reductase
MPSTDKPVPVLLLGAGGMLAHDLAATAPNNVTLATGDGSNGRLDITNRRALMSALDSVRPRWVVNAAAYTKVDQAERETDVALAVNATALAALGAECAARQIRVVHYSTDYVFSGNGDRPYREDDDTSPINAYGLTKFRGEQELTASGARALIIRTQWLFGRAGRSFPRTMWERATKGLTTRVVTDQTGRPTYSRDLAGWTWKLVARDAEGIVHAANAGTATWFDVASRVFDRVGLDYLVTPSSTSDNPTPARRPAYSVLDTTKLEEAVGLLRSWQDALDDFLSELERGG